MQTAPPGAAPIERRVSVRRRVAAAVYDALALIGIWFVVAGIAVGLHHGEALPADAPVFHAALLVAAWGYLAGCWHRGGQTLGMKSWRIRAVDRVTGGPLDWGQATVRFVVAVLHWVPLAFAVWAFWFTSAPRALVIGAGALLAFGYWWFLGGRGEALIDRAARSMLVFRA